MALINTIDPAGATTGLRDWWGRTRPGVSDVVVTDVHIPRSSGMSSETVLFRVAHLERGVPTEQELVARVIAPDRNLFPGNDFDVERQVMHSVTTTAVPAPTVYGIEHDESVLGAPFLVMERLHGRVLADDPPYTAQGWLLDVPAEQQAELYDNALAALAGISQAATASLPARMVGHPDGPGSPMGQHLDHWEHFYAWGARERVHPVVEHGLRWMRDNMPVDDRPPVLSWGDARLGNLMFGPDHQVTGVLDWEITTLGPPELDLAWFTVVNRIYTDGFGLPSPPGFPNREETVARYQEITGRDVRDLEYYEVFAALRSSIILLRLGTMMTDAGVLPADDPLPFNNPPSQVLAALLDVELPAGDATWFAGRR